MSDIKVRGGSRVAVELLHLTDTRWRGDVFERHGTGSYRVNPMTLTRPGHGVEKQACHCHQCSATFTVAVHSAEEVRRNAWRGGLVLLAGVTTLLLMLANDDGSPATVWQGLLLLASLFAIGWGAWSFNRYLDLLRNQGVPVGRLGAGARDGFATHVLRRRK